MILDGHAPGHVARAADALAAGQLVGLPEVAANGNYLAVVVVFLEPGYDY